MSDQKKKTDGILDPPSVQQMQTEFNENAKDILKRLKEYREEIEEIKKDLPDNVQKAMEGVTSKYEKELLTLRKKQDELSAKFAAPRLGGKEAEKATDDKQMKAFFKKLRNVYVKGAPRLTQEDYADLYPENKTYYFPCDPGSPNAALGPAEARALVEDTTGEILVPESLEAEIMRAVGKLAVVRPLATVKTITSNRERYRAITELSMAYGTSLEIGGTATESTPTPSEEHQYIEDMHGLVKFGENELDDSDFNLMTFMVDSFSRAKGELEDTKFIEGAGHASHEPVGLLNSTTITRITAAASDAVVYEDILDLMHGYEDSNSTPLPAAYQRNGVFILHPFTELALLKIEDKDERPLWWPSMAVGLPNTLYGKAVYTQEDMPLISTGNDVIIYGDIRATYRIIDRQGLSIFKLNELYRLGGLVGFRPKCRNTGGIVRAAACRILDMA